MKENKRVVVYIDKDEYNHLQSILRRSGKTVSGWFRALVRKFIQENK